MKETNRKETNNDVLTIKQIEAIEAMGVCPEGYSFPISFGDSPHKTGPPPAPVMNLSSLDVHVKEGVESHIVQLAEKAEQDACKRMQEECHSNLPPAITFPTDAEWKAFDAKNELVQKYEGLYGSELQLNLLSHGAASPLPGLRTASDQSLSSGMPVVVAEEEKKPSAMELKEKMLKICTLRHVDNQVFVFDKIYRKLTNNKLATLITEKLYLEIHKYGSPSIVNQIAQAIRFEPSIALPALEEPKGRLPMLNGVLNLQSMKLEPFSPNWMFTWQFQTSWIDEESNTCPNFDRFLCEIVGGNEILWERFWEYIAYVLFARGQPAKKFFVMYGPSGNNGKSVLGDVLSSFYTPDQISSLSMAQMGERFSTSALAKTQLNINNELSSDPLPPKAVGFLKACTGRDSMQVSVKYKDDLVIKVNCPLVFGTNHRICLAERDDAFMDRMAILPFQYSIPPERRDPNLTARLIEERPGIFYKASFFFRHLVERGYRFTGDDLVNEIVNSDQFITVDQTLNSSSLLDEILPSFVESHLQADPGSFIASNELLSAYLAYSKIGDSTTISPHFSKLFYSKLRQYLTQHFDVTLKKQRVNKTPVSGYLGIGWVPSADSKHTS